MSVNLLEQPQASPCLRRTPDPRCIANFKVELPLFAKKLEKGLLGACPHLQKRLDKTENPHTAQLGELTKREPVLSSHLMWSYQQYETA